MPQEPVKADQRSHAQPHPLVSDLISETFLYLSPHTPNLGRCLTRVIKDGPFQAVLPIILVQAPCFTLLPELSLLGSTYHDQPICLCW